MSETIYNILENGENSFVEFKEVTVSPQSLAEEITAFSNSRSGGYIFLGVADDGRVTGIDIKKKAVLEETVMNICRNNIVPPLIPIFETIKLGDKWIVRLTITEGIEKPYQTVQGKYMIRVGTTKRVTSREELLRLFQNARICHIDDYPVPGAAPDNLDLLKISSFFNDIYDLSIKDMTLQEQEKLLINSCILNVISDKPYATIAGLIFFSSRFPVFAALERYLPQAGIQFVAYEDHEMASILDRMDCYDSCPGAIDAIVQKIRVNWKTPSRIKGLKREEVSFPVSIFRELIVNAVIHRDYSLQSRIQVKMFPDRIEVITPGRLANTVTIEKMKAGISVPRNPILIKFMQNYRYADQLGRGIPMILKQVEKMPGYSFDLIEDQDRLYAVLNIPRKPVSGNSHKEALR